MKTRQTSDPALPEPEFPDPASLMALRGWFAGLSSRTAVARYLPGSKAAGQSARGILGRIRRQLIAFAYSRQRGDLAALFDHSIIDRADRASAVERAIEALRSVPAPHPQISDDIGLWLAPRAVQALRAYGINTLAELTVRIPRRRGWWKVIAGLGPASARKIEAFFASSPELTERARALIVASRDTVLVPWEELRLPHELNGSQGNFRAPLHTCTLNATNDYQAVQAWLALHETPATQRAYRKEAERLILWAIIERNRALSSLTTDDAIVAEGFDLLHQRLLVAIGVAAPLAGRVQGIERYGEPPPCDLNQVRIGFAHLPPRCGRKAA